MRLYKPMILSGLLILLISLACSLTGQTPQVIVVTSTPLPQQSSTAAPVEDQSPTDQPKPVIITPTPAPAVSLLPSPVYYLAADSNGVDQVWWLNVDGKTVSQFTHSAEKVENYDISLTNGIVAYVSGNDLYVQPSAADEAIRVVDEQPYQESIDLWYANYAIDNLVWSHDGSRLAFYHGGFQIYTPSDGSIQTLLTNNPGTNEFRTDFEGYAPLAWSPDDSRMVLSINRYEGGPMGLYTFADHSMTVVTKADGGYPCCEAVWNPDGSKFYVAGYEYGGVGSDLWSFDGYSGAATELISDMNSDETFNFCFFPTVIGDSIYFFNAVSSGEDASDLRLNLVSSPTADPHQMMTIRGDVPILDKALWAPDGSFALGQERQPGTDFPWPSQLIYIPAANQPIQVLLSNVHDIRWGD